MKKRIMAWFLVILSVLQLTGCGSTDGPRYQDDYYEYVNQDLLDEIELSADSPEWTWFAELSGMAREEMGEIIKELLEYDAEFKRGSSQQKIKDMYECVSNMQNRNETGLGPLKPHMDRIRNAQNIAEKNT